MKTLLAKPRWRIARLKAHAVQWLNKMQRKKRALGEQSPWWDFLFYWKVSIDDWLDQFIEGTYLFSPMVTYRIGNEKIIMWQYRDRLVLSLLLQIIKPLFAYLVPRCCFHLKGPAGVKVAINQVLQALKARPFRYIIRADIASYYASIDHGILQQQLKAQLNDSRLLYYLQQIITIGIEEDGAVYLPQKGIPIRSSLSPFFGAVYLSPLDQAFSNRKGIFYVRYMDDVIVLAETKRQFVAAKKRLYAVLKTLKLKLSRSKTRMGLIKSGLHFLGVEFNAAQTALDKNQAVAVQVSIHPRSCRRALDKARAMEADFTPVKKVQRYLVQWAAWWARTIRQFFISDMLQAFLLFTRPVSIIFIWLLTGRCSGLAKTLCRWPFS